MAVSNFQKCEVGYRSVVRWSVINIHTSYTDLIYSSFATLGTQRARSKNKRLLYSKEVDELLERIELICDAYGICAW